MHGWARRNGFTWRGKQTVDEILSRLTPPARVEIMLPENYNHALFAVLSPEANVAQTEAANARTEALKIEGDVALVTKVAKIRGLEDLAALIEPLSKLEATVTVLSPPQDCDRSEMIHWAFPGCGLAGGVPRKCGETPGSDAVAPEIAQGYLMAAVNVPYPGRGT